MSYSYPSLWTSEEVDALTGGFSSQVWQADDLTIRADDVRPGDVFFASAGDNLNAVFERGAVAAVVSRGVPVAADLRDRYPILSVPCAYEALRALARASRQRTHSVVIAVQGFEQRTAFSRALGAVADYYEGGRHLSSAMAAMPEKCEYSVFSLSPSLSPDIAVIDRPSALRDDSLFEKMPANGVVLLNGDDPAYISVLATAKSHGLSHILTYGQTQKFESHLTHHVAAKDTLQAGVHVLGKEATVQMPLRGALHAPSLNMLLAAMTVAQLSDMKIKDYAWAMAEVYVPSPHTHAQGDQPGFHGAGAQHKASHKVHNKISVLDPSHLVEEAIFKVKNMIDTGVGRRTLVLDQGAPLAKEQDFTLPTRLGGVDVVCASRKVSVFKNARKAIEGLIKGCKLHHIVPEVLTPGDYVVFKSSQDTSGTVFSESLRLHN